MSQYIEIKILSFIQLIQSHKLIHYIKPYPSIERFPRLLSKVNYYSHHKSVKQQTSYLYDHPVYKHRFNKNKKGDLMRPIG